MKYSQVSCQIAALSCMDAINLLTHYQQSVIKTLNQRLSLILGEVVSARVQARHSDKVYDLQIQGRQIRVESAKPLQPGSVLRLRVDQVDNPVVLKVIDPGTEVPRKNEQLVLEQTRSGLLREAIPRQKPLQPLFRKLFSLATQPVPDKPQLPQSVQETVAEFRQLVRKYPDLATPKQIRQAIERSGLFLESRLATQSRAPQTTHPLPDMKAVLLKLSQQLSSKQTPQSHIRSIAESPVQHTQTRNTGNAVTGLPSAKTAQNIPLKSGGGTNIASTEVLKSAAGKEGEINIRQDRAVVEQRLPLVTELKQQVEAGLARIHVQQNNAVVSDSHPQPVWAVEIPVQDGENLQSIALTIHEDSRHQEQSTERGWTATVQLDLEELGSVQIRLGLQGDEISASIRAEMPATVELFENNLDGLASRFSKAGLRVDQLRCMHGTTPETRYFQPQSLVDIQL